MEQEKWVQGKRLHYGYTTGTCAAAAAGAATGMLLSGERAETWSLLTPKGWQLELAIEDCSLQENEAICAVRKQSGDDPDVTDGMLIYATVQRQPEGITIDGGQGIGRVTLPGLNQPPGEAAINRVPREMITAEVQQACRRYGYEGGIRVTIWAPLGEAIAKETYNPKLGIVGGISILGTSGIVEPMSQQALLDTMETELSVMHAAGKHNVMLVLGNYGERFVRDTLQLELRDSVKCSNYIGAALDLAVQYRFEKILLAGHIGKLCKLGAGIRNTHSAEADGRLEVLLRCALRAGASLELLREMDKCVTTDGALQLMQSAGILQPSMEVLLEQMEGHLHRNLPASVQLELICFTSREDLPDILCESSGAHELAQLWRKDGV